MALQSLVFTADQYILGQLRSVLRDLGIGVEVCRQAERAGECLRSQHFDVAILDVDSPSVDEVARQWQSATSSLGAPLFLIGSRDRSAPMPFAGLASSVLYRPLTLEEIWRTLRGARQQMESSMFRYFRVRVESGAQLTRSDGSVLQAALRNVGVNGVGLRVAPALEPGETVALEFDLSGCRRRIASQAEVVWANAQGDAGLCFTTISSECRSALEAWIARRLQDREFAFVFNEARETLRPMLIPATAPNP